MFAKLIAIVIHELAEPIVREYRRINAPSPPCPYEHADSQSRDATGTTGAHVERAPQWDHERRRPAAFGFGPQ